ncbi:major facilitator superfamily MFS_1 [Gluconacetobacter diazotrophicus PA1 5]|uniref:MFS transporter n=1 Tax=Gluconacetobacter diazotrophicus TaxID=33996 RepID=UPI000173B7F1|nr:MFS transporter [Gluconacetobacter diazotrophicus]ACI52651.1 major facilitator superfamily MFS_1 [Gluconacetobacter diazotrophicus PA1 5]TWB06058.1 ACS family hexuronate transporter-like MFS transporter [Gluconacetobacter diazotrophicus]
MARAFRLRAGFPPATLIVLCLIVVVSTADRQIIALIKPVLDRTFGWSTRDYARISLWTQVASAGSLLVSGWLVDRFGSRRVLGTALAGWSLMTVLHAVVTSVRGFVLVRATLGALEGAGMPSVMKVVATTVPRAERGRVIGMVNAVPNVAAVLTPVLAGLLLPWVGWKALVAGLGATGLVLAALWCAGLPKARPAREDGAAQPARADGSRSEAGSLAHGDVRRFVAVFSLCKVLSDATWWLLLYWLPDILHTQFGLGLRGVGVASGAVYVGAGLGSVLGGVLPALLPARAGSRERARRTVMGGAALCVVPMLFVHATHTALAGIGLFALGLMAHQVFSTNLFGIVTEWAPSALVGRVMGIGAFCGNLGGAALLWLTGFVPMPFVLGACSLSYLAAWGVLRAWAGPGWLERAFRSAPPGAGPEIPAGISLNAASAPPAGSSSGGSPCVA